MQLQTYLRFKPIFDQALAEIYKAGGTKWFAPQDDCVKIAHLKQMQGLGLVEEIIDARRSTFRITDTGLCALEAEPNDVEIDEFMPATA
jgi:hypothetical protein